MNPAVHHADVHPKPKALIGCRCGSMLVRHMGASGNGGGLHRIACAACERRTSWFFYLRSAIRAWNREFAR